ncbi:MAG: response regulator, partial [Flavobacteriales bacterium]
EACRLKDYDLIFMDVQMPEMDGLEATRSILSNESSYGSPYIIAITAGAFEEDMKLCLDSGMKDFISKPIMLDRLKSAITKFRELVEL